jgi:very-short-patch-repair endonuclease
MDAPRTTKDRAKSLRRQMSLPEVLLWKALKGRKLQGLRFGRQHPIGPYVLDFYCEAERLAVEVDGGSHDFGDRPERDQRRDAWVLAQGVTTPRLSASLILNDVDDATRAIFAHLEGADDADIPRPRSSPRAKPDQGEDLESQIPSRPRSC